MRRKVRNRDVDTFKKDLKDFSESAAGYIPGLGEVLAIRDTYQKGERLTVSGPKALRVARRRARSRVNRAIRRMRRYFG